MTNYKILGQTAPSQGVADNIYTVPTGKSTVVRAIDITNTSTTTDTIDLAINDSAIVSASMNAIVATSIIGTNNKISYSTDNGTSWTASSLPSSQQWKQVAYGNDRFVAVAYYSPVAAYAQDPATWTQTTLPVNSYWNAIGFGNGKFVAGTLYNNYGAISTNGVTWTLIGASLPRADQITYGNGRYVITSGNSNMYSKSSTDGVTWDSITLPGSNNWTSAAYGNATWVMVSQGQYVARSTNGVTWTASTNPQYQFWNSIVFASSKFVCVGWGPTNIASYTTDGVTWSASTLPSSQNWKSVTHNGNMFVAVSESAAVAASTDGITWTARTNSSSSEWGSVTNGQAIVTPSINSQDYLFKSYEILGNETVTIKGGYTLAQGNTIRVKSNNGTTAFHAFGGEI